MNGTVFSAASIGPKEVMLREAAPLPDGPAEMIAVIDGHESRWSVRIEDRHLARRIVPVEILTYPS